MSRKEDYERTMDMARPLTPKSERRPAGRIAPVSVQMTQGLCQVGKCVLKAGHAVPHWPSSFQARDWSEVTEEACI